MAVRDPRGETGAFDEFQASELFCGRCGRSRPVRERLLLVLPQGELHEYLCAQCGNAVGTRRVTSPPPTIHVRR